MIRNRLACALSLAVQISATALTAQDARGLQEAPANTWVLLASEVSGSREWPLFYFDPTLDKFVLSGGIAKGKAHFDTEFFDLATRTWTNAYPEGAPYKVPSGPSDAPGIDIRDNEPPLKADKNGVIRLLRGLNPYGRDPGFFHQFAYAPSKGKCFAYLQDATLAFDPKSRAWTNLQVPRFSKSVNSCLMYGALAYDPINKEVLSIGGTSDEDGGTPGTWLFSPAEGTWRKLNPGSDELKKLNGDAATLCEKMAAFLNACRNRCYATESTEGAAHNLAAEAEQLSQEARRLAERLHTAKCGGAEAKAPRGALPMIERAALGLAEFGKELSVTPPAKLLLDGETLLAGLQAAERALDTEPCGRAASPAVTCYAQGKILLFGGCRMDGYLADTWAYDCKTRTWEQRYPKVCPPGRAGHVLGWLPRSGKAVLYGAVPFTGGYGVPHGNTRPPQDLWSYDVEADEWKVLAKHDEASPLDVVGAIGADDVLVAVGWDRKDRKQRRTWGLRVAPNEADAGNAEAGVPPGTYTQAFDTPADYDRVNAPDAQAQAKFLKELPANQWTLMAKPAKAINPHPWGTCPYDERRHQLISFGGGHSAAHFTDVAHYSLRSATWSVGFAEEYPYANASFKAMFNQTFNNRPTVPTHVWDGAAFDSVTGKVVYCVRGGTWLYDPDRRAWSYPPVWEKGGSPRINLTPTPRGVAYWEDLGRGNGVLCLFDAQKRAWSKLLVTGQPVPGADSDFSGMCYDSKRDCLWLSRSGNPMYRYDMNSGDLAVAASPGSPENVCMRETVYVPELDMLVSAGRATGAGGEVGNLAYDIANQKWIGLHLPCSDGQPRVNDKPYSSISLSIHYDSTYKLLLYHSNAQEILLARIDKGSLKTFDAKIAEPKK